MKIFKQITKIFSREKQNMLTEAVGPIPFHLTTRRSPTTNSFDIRQRNLESWITKLPIAHIGQTARLLFTAIRDMNELDIPSMDRFKAMEQLFPILVRVDGDISKRHTESFPLSGKASVVANLLKEFKEAISTSYKIIIVDILHNDKTIDTTILVTAIHHSLWYLGQVLLDSYKIYNIPPAMLWREMHWFYKFCEQNNLHQKVVITHNLPDDYIYLIPDTVEGVYKQVLLMSITNPYSLHHTETSKLYRKIGEWQKYCTLWRTNKEADYFTESFNADGEGLFIIELESDNQPITCSEKIYLDFSEKDCALIDTQNLHSIIDTYNIENKNTRISLKTIHDNLADNTIRRLIVGCVKASDRAFLRRKTSDNDGIEMILGFSAVHAALGQSASPMAASREIDLISKEPQLSTEYDLDIVYSSGPVYLDGSNIQTTPQQCLLLDQSEGGVRLVWSPEKEDKQSKVEVGHLAALRRTYNQQNQNKRSTWSIGVVRWIKCISSGEIELGVQYIAPRARPLFVVTAQANQENELKRALLLPEISVINQPATLLIPPFMCNSNDKLTFSYGEKQIRILLKNKIESSLSFVRFHFIRLDLIVDPKLSKFSPPIEKSETRQEVQVKQASDKFSELWSHI